MMILHPNLYLPETCYKGQIPIYSCFVTPDVTHLVGAYLSKGVGMGDHITMVLDTQMRQLMGLTQPKIEIAKLRWLTGKIPLTQKRYINTINKLLEERVYYEGIKTFFYDTLNGHIDDKQLLIRAEYLYALKELCTKEV